MSMREHLDAIYETYGKLTPALVVDVARAEDHPLHGYVFDRAPEDAAESWYRHRAHELIQSYKISYRKTEDGPTLRVRAFHAVRSEDGEYVYEPVEKVASDPMLREIVLRDMEREWKQLHKRFGEFEEFVEMVSSDLGISVA